MSLPPPPPTPIIRTDSSTEATGLLKKRQVRHPRWTRSDNLVTLSHIPNFGVPWGKQADIVTRSLAAQAAGVFSEDAFSLSEAEDCYWDSNQQESHVIGVAMGAAIMPSVGTEGTYYPDPTPALVTTERFVNLRAHRPVTRAVQNEAMVAQISDIFCCPVREAFEPGMLSTFADELLKQIDRHGADAVNETQILILKPSTDPRIASEALRWLGRANHAASRRLRREVLEGALSHLVPDVRDAAILGLASLDDPEAIPALEAAEVREPLAMVREDIRDLLQQLRGR